MSDFEDKIYGWGAIAGGILGLIAGFQSAGIGGAIVGAVVGGFAGLALTGLIPILFWLGVFGGIIALIIFIISSLWGVGKP